MEHIKKAADCLVTSKSAEEKAESLSRAFELFSQETNRLETAYNALQTQFSTLTKELELANAKLRQKVLALDITAHYLESILANMSQGLIFIDLNGQITTYNQAAEQLLGKKQEEVLFRHFNEVFPDTLFHFSMSKAIEEAECPKLSYATVEPEGQAGETREIMVETTFVLRGEGPINTSLEDNSEFDYTLGMIALIRDITEIRRLQLIATRNDRMKDLGEMAAMVAHEIRNPLGGIKGFASLLVRDLKDQPQLQQMAAYIVEGTDSLNSLVTNVLNYSRPLKLEFHPVEVNTLIEELVKHVRMDSAIGQNVQIKTRLAKNIKLMLDTQHFKSALLNLMVNAVQAMPQGGTITVTLKEEKGFGSISIKDTGEGIPQENLEKIFRPFFTTKREGYGFGLTEVFRVIQAHNGAIDVSSTLGEGSLFTIKIPL